MAARVAKNMIRALLREKMKQLKVPSSEPYRYRPLDLIMHLLSVSSRLLGRIVVD
jgi:hypothetical protein